MGHRENRAWADGVLEQLQTKADLEADQFVFLAGEKYRRHLIPSMTHYEVPMEGLTIGRQLQFLTRALNRESV